jgi:LAS superfamily LD-carboxypeptidase LdcB
MEGRAAAAGVILTATSGFRGWAEQAVLYAQLGPRLAAPPGASRHHDATELDVAVGPAGSATHRWLQAHGPAHGFIQRYSWEPWHWGYVAGC